MEHRRRMLGTTITAFLVGGLSVGLALWAAGALPATESGLAFGAFLFFPFMFKILFMVFLFAVLFRFIGGGRRGYWGPWAHHGGEPGSSMHAWHAQAHAEAEGTLHDKNADGDENSPDRRG